MSATFAFRLLTLVQAMAFAWPAAAAGIGMDLHTPGPTPPVDDDDDDDDAPGRGGGGGSIDPDDDEGDSDDDDDDDEEDTLWAQDAHCAMMLALRRPASHVTVSTVRLHGCPPHRTDPRQPDHRLLISRARQYPRSFTG